MNTTGKKRKALRTVDRTSFDTNRNSAEKTLSSLHCLIKYYSFLVSRVLLLVSQIIGQQKELFFVNGQDVFEIIKFDNSFRSVFTKFIFIFFISITPSHDRFLIPPQVPCSVSFREEFQSSLIQNIIDG